MEKCQHNRAIVSFCIYEYCSSKGTAGCQECMKKYHSHFGNAEIVKIEQTIKLIQKFNVENHVKPKCRQFQELVFSFFTQIKNQISQSIDIVAKSMVNKIGYPLLSNLNNLTAFKRIKNREYKKVSAKQIKKFCEQSKNLDSETITRKDRELYIEEIRQNYEVIESFENLMEDYNKLVKKFNKNFKHDLTSFKKIEDLKKYLNLVLKIDKINKKQSKQKQKQIGSKTLLSNLETSPSSQKDFKPILNLIDRQYQNASALSRPQQTERVRRINKQFFQSNVRNNNKKIEFFSIEKDIKLFQQDTFDKKEREIFQRKQKLMKLMNSKEKSIGNLMENSIGKQLNFIINPPPQLSFENNTPQKSKKNQKVQRHSEVHKKKTLDNYFKVEIAKNIDVSVTKSSPPKSNIKREDSISQLRQDLFSYSKESKDAEQNQCDQKYKYALRQLPSNQSGSSQEENFIQSFLNETGQNSKCKMTQSSPVKTNSYSNVLKDVENVTNQQRSAYFFLHSLKLPTQQAISYLKQSINCYPKNVSAAEYLSFFYLKDDKAKECLDLCNDYLTFLTKFEDTEIKINFINNKCAALNILGRYSESIIILEQQIIHFQHAKMYKNLGDAYFFIGINEKCQYNYEKAVKLDSKFDEAMYNLAACLFSQGNFYGADIWIRKALEINERNSQYLTLQEEIKKRMKKLTQQNLN